MHIIVSAFSTMVPMIYRNAAVFSIDRQWNGVQQASVRIVEAPQGASVLLPGDMVKAVIYTAMVGEVREGDILHIECSALAKNLGTGGAAMTVCCLSRLAEDRLPDNDGHVVKARYTPSQIMVSSADEQQSPHHKALKAQRSLDPIPVVATDLHSALPAICAGIRSVDASLRIACVYTDGAALPAWFSMALSTLRDKEWLASVVTSGQSFGGDIESASLPSALIAAQRIAKADVIISCQGPGNLGTGTPYGYSGVDVGWALTCAHQLGGQPICALRICASDKRDRHIGVSHHALTVLERLTPVPTTIVKPIFDAAGLSGPKVEEPWRNVEAFNARIDSQLEHATSIAEHHSVIACNVDAVRESVESCPVKLSSMGRTYYDDATPFLGAAVAGRYAAELVAGKAPKV